MDFTRIPCPFKGSDLSYRSNNIQQQSNTMPVCQQNQLPSRNSGVHCTCKFRLFICRSSTCPMLNVIIRMRKNFNKYKHTFYPICYVKKRNLLFRTNLFKIFAFLLCLLSTIVIKSTEVISSFRLTQWYNASMFRNTLTVG